MIFHEGAVAAVAREIHLARYLSHSVTDEDLVTKVLEGYHEHKPNRDRVGDEGRK